MSKKTNNKIKSATTYPMVLLVLLLAMFVGMFTLILPMFRQLAGDDIPPLSAAMFSISDFLIAYWWIILIVLGVLIFAISVIIKIPSVKFKWDELKTKIPKVGPLLCTIYTARFARTMANLFASGLQMVDCIEKSVDTLNNGYISKVFKTNVVEDVKHGEALSTAVAKAGIFPGIFTSIIMVGEESGALDDILSKSADYYEDEADTALQKLVTYIEPCIIIFMGLMVGFVMAAILPAMYASYQNIA